MSAAAQAAALHAFHVPGRPLILPNAWDAASARAVEAAGFLAVATGSAAVAESLGFPDDDSAPADEMFAAIARIARAVTIPVTADIEGGYGLPAAELVDRLLAAGAVGCNLEDGDHRRGGLVDAQAQADRIAAFTEAAAAAGVRVLLNARVDVFLGEAGPPGSRLAEALRRARLYAAAGAACVYPIWLADEPTISAFVEGSPVPINIYARPEAPGVARLAALGVGRISYGPWLHRLAMRSATEALGRIRAGESPYT